MGVFQATPATKSKPNLVLNNCNIVVAVMKILTKKQGLVELQCAGHTLNLVPARDYNTPKCGLAAMWLVEEYVGMGKGKAANGHMELDETAFITYLRGNMNGDWYAPRPLSDSKMKTP